MLKIAATALEAIGAHAEEGYPFEICGFLVGSVDADIRTARTAWPVRNAWEDDPEQRAKMFTEASAQGWEAYSTERRFLVSPRDTVAAMKRAREAGMDLIGLYHTHPNHPAEPSAFDREAAWPDWSYVILSVRDGAVTETRSWVVEGDGPFVEETIEPA